MISAMPSHRNVWCVGLLLLLSHAWISVAATDGLHDDAEKYKTYCTSDNKSSEFFPWRTCKSAELAQVAVSKCEMAKGMIEEVKVAAEALLLKADYSPAEVCVNTVRETEMKNKVHRLKDVLNRCVTAKSTALNQVLYYNDSLHAEKRNLTAEDKLYAPLILGNASEKVMVAKGYLNQSNRALMDAKIAVLYLLESCDDYRRNYSKREKRIAFRRGLAENKRTAAGDNITIAATDCDGVNESTAGGTRKECRRTNVDKQEGAALPTTVEMPISDAISREGYPQVKEEEEDVAQKKDAAALPKTVDVPFREETSHLLGRENSSIVPPNATALESHRPITQIPSINITLRNMSNSGVHNGSGWTEEFYQNVTEHHNNGLRADNESVNNSSEVQKLSKIVKERLMSKDSSAPMGLSRYLLVVFVSACAALL